MKITDKELRELVREVVRKKVATLKEGEDFSARREVVEAAKTASRTFEKEIVKLLGLIPPDELPDNLQQAYYVVVDDMKEAVVTAVMNATRELAKFPKPRKE